MVVRCCVAEQLGGDVDGQSAGDGFGGEDPPEVVRGVAQRLPGGVAAARRGRPRIEQVLHGVQADRPRARCHRLRRWNRCGSGGPVRRSCGS